MKNLQIGVILLLDHSLDVTNLFFKGDKNSSKFRVHGYLNSKIIFRLMKLIFNKDMRKELKTKLLPKVKLILVTNIYKIS
jgi:hypothetical protein